jgi:hypothetical protein
MLSGLCAYLLGLIAALQQAAAGNPAALEHRIWERLRSMPTLEVTAAFEMSGARAVTPVADVRWASRDTIHVLRYEDGVTEHRLRHGLPQVRPILPGRRPGVLGGEFLSRSGSRLLAATSVTTFLWTDVDVDDPASDYEAFGPRGGGIGDAEIDGDTLVVLGYPNDHTWMNERETALWKASLEDHLQEWDPVASIEAGTEEALGLFVRHSHAGAASMRFLPDGKLFVFRGYPPTGLLLSPGGRIIDRWNLVAELGGDEDANDWLTPPGSGVRRASVLAWAERAWTVDEALVIDRKPAVLLRRVRNGRPHWFLVIWESDEGTWYRVPFATLDTSLRLRADANNRGEIVLLTAPRGMELGLAPGLERVLVARLP